MVQGISLFWRGMTRSGKNTFLLSVAAIRKNELDPPLHMVIFDRRGKYVPLVEKFGGKRFSYKDFAKPFKDADPDDIASMLKVSGKLEELVSSAVATMQEAIKKGELTELTKEAF